jgi:Peptidase C13 family
MPDLSEEDVFELVKAKAFRRLTPKQTRNTNLYLDQRVRQAGETLGPKIQKITLDAPSILVFADDEPQANFAHSCRYLLFNPETGDLRNEIPARFPPYLSKAPESLMPFHQPVRFVPNPNLYHTWASFRCPALIPDGNRYAILYAGMTDTRHLNDLEFCYRMLEDMYGFSASNIYVLNYDGTLNTKDGPPGNWPGDNTPYRIQVTGQGTQKAFQAAFNDLATKIGADDLLFIHTNNHGDNTSGQSYMCQYPDWDSYWSSDFCTDMSVLPNFKSLVVMMEQCNSGGFNAPVIAASPATNTSIAAAAISTESSYASADGNWDVFAYEWIAAQFGHNPDGSALSSNPDTNHDGVIEADEAYDYAQANDTVDTPCFDESSAAGGNITLTQQYEFYWMWCIIWWPILVKYYPILPNPPDPQFYQKLQKVLPEIQKEIIPILNSSGAAARTQAAPKIEAALARVFKDKR